MHLKLFSATSMRPFSDTDWEAVRAFMSTYLSSVFWTSFGKPNLLTVAYLSLTMKVGGTRQEQPIKVYFFDQRTHVSLYD